MSKIMNVYKKLSDNTKKLSKIDYIIIGIMVLIYGIISFYHLGDTRAPKTFSTLANEGDSIQVNLGNEYNVSRMIYWGGNEIGAFSIYGSIDGNDYNLIKSISINEVLSWHEVKLDSRMSTIKFVSNRDGSTIGDIILYDDLGERISIPRDSSNPLVDEEEFDVEKESYLTRIYFDEIYHARSAYEYVHGIDVYEWTHPPLGKLIIAIPIYLFGYNIFNARLMGNIAGILLIPVMYILCKKIFKNRKYALLGGLLMMFDTFHFAHTRIALVDGFELLFILLSVIFMKNYLDLDKKDNYKKKAKNLLLSGFFIGCAITTKWNALYPALGLAIVFFVHLAKEYNFNLIKYCKEKINANNIFKLIFYFVLVPLLVYYVSFVLFSKNVCSTIVLIYFALIVIYLLIKFILFLKKDSYLSRLFFTCVIGFVLIPLTIYVLSFILFPNVGYYNKTLTGIIDQTKFMYDYHANLQASHPFSSNWYSWPIMYKPVWFYTSQSISGMRSTIVDIGNPFIWWFGIPSFVYLVISAIKKNKTSIFILIFILSSFVPYIFIGRIMFMYHYFIVVPFIMLGIVGFIKWLLEKTKNDKIYWVYVGCVIAGFIIFYPVVSGMWVSEDYINSIKWLSSWVF